MENVIIIGGGPSGLAAGLYTSRANLSPLLFAGSPPGGQLMLTTLVENYPGYESILGPELIQKLRSHNQKFGVKIVDENIVKVNFNASPFELSTISKTYKARTIIIATGAKALWLGLESETRLRGKGISSCATCDAFFFREKTVAVVGGGDTAMEDALTLTKFAKKVYVVHRRDTFRASKIMADRVLNHPKIEIIWNSSVEEVLGEEKVTGVKLKSTVDSSSKELKLDGLFIAIGHKPDTDIFKGQVELNNEGYIVTSAQKAVQMAKSSVESKGQINPDTPFDFKYQYITSVSGVFAAGDNVDFVYRQAGTAVGAGIAAALEVERYLESAENE